RAKQRGRVHRRQPTSAGRSRAPLRGLLGAGAGRAGGAGAARGAHAATDLLLAVLLKVGVERLDRGEDLVRGRLLLLARGLLDLREQERLAVLDEHLRELQLLPVAHALRAVDRDRHHRRARLQREAADSGPRLVADLAAARAAALAVHDDRTIAVEDRV